MEIIPSKETIRIGRRWPSVLDICKIGTLVEAGIMATAFTYRTEKMSISHKSGNTMWSTK